MLFQCRQCNLGDCLNMNSKTDGEDFMTLSISFGPMFPLREKVATTRANTIRGTT